MSTVYLGLGSNIGDSRQYLEKAITHLKEFLRDVKTAPFYTSKAVGYTDQPDFLNTAVSGQTDLEPGVLLEGVKSIERQVGRTPSFHWGPRQIDIDIIFYGDRVLETENLTLPHPRFAERDFVLRPLTDLNPQIIDPVSGRTIEQFLTELKPEQRSILTKTP